MFPSLHQHNGRLVTQNDTFRRSTAFAPLCQAQTDNDLLVLWPTQEVTGSQVKNFASTEHGVKANNQGNPERVPALGRPTPP